MEQTLLRPIGKGQITIPGSWRKALGITKETFVKATLTANGVLLQNANINLYAEEDEKVFDDSIRNVFTDLGKSGELKKLSKILSEKYNINNENNIEI